MLTARGDPADSGESLLTAGNQFTRTFHLGWRGLWCGVPLWPEFSKNVNRGIFDKLLNFVQISLIFHISPTTLLVVLILICEAYFCAKDEHRLWLPRPVRYLSHEPRKSTSLQ
jgi:hypothetical protein